jgi:uncharacterized protein with ATP-grasp and redox domains
MTNAPLSRPRPIRANEPDSWAAHTVRQRQPEIVQQVLSDNAYLPATVARVRRFLEAFPDMPMRPLADEGAPDAGAWQGILQGVAGKSWLDIPWLVQEFAFYRYLLEAVGYFEPGPTQGQDPFAPQKRLALQGAARAIESLASRVPDPTAADLTSLAAFERHIALALWGNQADLSIWPAGGDGGGPMHLGDARQRAHTLVDHRPLLSRWLRANSLPLGRLDIIVDNAGMELASDLLLANYALRSGLAETVRLHLKFYPTFVSDALPRDVTETLKWLVNAEGEATRALGQRLETSLAEGRLEPVANEFWNLPLAFWDMPISLRAELGQADLIVSKGDANYRRLLGDLHWPFTTSLAVLADTVPAPFVALRTIKSELAAGLAPAQIRLVEAADPDWLTSGKWGLIQSLGMGATA